MTTVIYKNEINVMKKNFKNNRLVMLIFFRNIKPYVQCIRIEELNGRKEDAEIKEFLIIAKVTLNVNFTAIWNRGLLKLLEIRSHGSGNLLIFVRCLWFKRGSLPSSISLASMLGALRTLPFPFQTLPAISKKNMMKLSKL